MLTVTDFLRKRGVETALALLVLGVGVWLGYSLLQRLGIFSEAVALSSNAPLGGDQEGGREVKIVTVLPKDAIRAIDSPRFLQREEARGQMLPNEQVIGLSINGETKAYPVGMLSSHEIVNDVVGGRPLAVTW